MDCFSLIFHARRVPVGGINLYFVMPTFLSARSMAVMFSRCSCAAWFVFCTTAAWAERQAIATHISKRFFILPPFPNGIRFFRDLKKWKGYLQRLGTRQRFPPAGRVNVLYTGWEAGTNRYFGLRYSLCQIHTIFLCSTSAPYPSLLLVVRLTQEQESAAIKASRIME